MIVARRISARVVDACLVNSDKIPEFLARHAFHHSRDAKLYLVILRKMFVQPLHPGARGGCGRFGFTSLVALKQRLFRSRRGIRRPLDGILVFRRPSWEGDDAFSKPLRRPFLYDQACRTSALNSPIAWKPPFRFGQCISALRPPLVCQFRMIAIPPIFLKTLELASRQGTERRISERAIPDPISRPLRERNSRMERQRSKRRARSRL